MKKSGGGCSASPIWGIFRYLRGSDKMNDYISAIVNIVYIMLSIVLIDKFIELFKNMKK